MTATEQAHMQLSELAARVVDLAQVYRWHGQRPRTEFDELRGAPVLLNDWAEVSVLPDGTGVRIVDHGSAFVVHATPTEGDEWAMRMWGVDTRDDALKELALAVVESSTAPQVQTTRPRRYDTATRGVHDDGDPAREAYDRLVAAVNDVIHAHVIEMLEGHCPGLTVRDIRKELDDWSYHVRGRWHGYQVRMHASDRSADMEIHDPQREQLLWEAEASVLEPFPDMAVRTTYFDLVRLFCAAVPSLTRSRWDYSTRCVVTVNPGIPVTPLIEAMTSSTGLPRSLRYATREEALAACDDPDFKDGYLRLLADLNRVFGVPQEEIHDGALNIEITLADEDPRRFPDTMPDFTVLPAPDTRKTRP